MKHTAFRRITALLLVGILMISMSSVAWATAASDTVTEEFDDRTFTFVLDESGHVTAGTHTFMSEGEEVTETMSNVVYSEDESSFSCTSESDNGGTASWVFAVTGDSFLPLRNEWHSDFPIMTGVNIWDYAENTFTETVEGITDGFRIITQKTIDTNRYIRREFYDTNNGYYEILEIIEYSEDGMSFSANCTTGDGRVGVRFFRIAEDGREIEIRSDWSNENDGSHGTSYLQEGSTTLRVYEEWHDGGTVYRSWIDDESNYTTVRREERYYYYDENGELVLNYAFEDFDFTYDVDGRHYRFERDDCYGTHYSITVQCNENSDDIEIFREWTGEGFHGQYWIDFDNAQEHYQEWREYDTAFVYDISDLTSGEPISHEFERYEYIDGEQVTVWREKLYDYAWNEDYTRHFFTRETMEGQIGQVTCAIDEEGREIEIQWSWTNAEDGSHGESRLEEGGIRVDERWEDNDKRYSCDRRNAENDSTLYSEYREYEEVDGVKVLKWFEVRDNFTYSENSYDYTYNRELFNGEKALVTARFHEDGWEEELSREWTNEQEGTHGRAWLNEEDGCYHEERWEDNDKRFNYEIYVNGTDTRLPIYSEYREYDGDEIIWTDIKSDYSYSADGTEYTAHRECSDGRVGTQHASWSEDWNCFFDDEYNWETPDGAHGCERNNIDGISINDSWHNNDRSHNIYTWERDTGRKVSSANYEYDENGELVWSWVESDFCYDEENGIVYNRYENYFGTEGYQSRREWDGFELTDDWRNEGEGVYGELRYVEEEGIYTEEVREIVGERLIQSYTYNVDRRILSEEIINYFDDSPLNMHTIRWYDGNDNVTGMAVRHYAGDTLVISSEYDEFGDLTRVEYREENGEAHEYIIGEDPTLRLPSQTQIIASEAFAGCAAEIVYVPDGIEYIAEDAFDSDTLLVVSDNSQAAEICGSIDHIFAVSHVDI